MNQRDLDFATTEQMLMYLMQNSDKHIRFHSPDVNPDDDTNWDYWQFSWRNSEAWIDGEYRPVQGFYVEHRQGHADWSGYPSRYDVEDEDGEYYDDDDDDDYYCDDWNEYSTATMSPEEVLTKMNEIIETGFKPAFAAYW